MEKTTVSVGICAFNEESNIAKLLESTINQDIFIPGIRLFSKTRSLALAAWLGGLEPVRIILENTQIILEAGQSDRWLVTDIDEAASIAIQTSLKNTKEKADGIQFISVQATPNDTNLAGFWMMRDMQEI